MSTRMARWARHERTRLLAVLGNRCTACGAVEDLQFDCIEPTGHAHHRQNTGSRICYYRKQMRQGNIQLLCGRCNVLKGDMPGAAWRAWLTTERVKKLQSITIIPCEYSEQVPSSLLRKHFDEEDL